MPLIFDSLVLASGSGAAGSSPSSSAGGNAVLTAQDLHLTPVQRQAIDQANKNSFAFFIPQGNVNFVLWLKR